MVAETEAAMGALPRVHGAGGCTGARAAALASAKSCAASQWKKRTFWWPTTSRTLVTSMSWRVASISTAFTRAKCAPKLMTLPPTHAVRSVTTDEALVFLILVHRMRQCCRRVDAKRTRQPMYGA